MTNGEAKAISARDLSSTDQPRGWVWVTYTFSKGIRTAHPDLDRSTKKIRTEGTRVTPRPYIVDYHFFEKGADISNWTTQK